MTVRESLLLKVRFGKRRSGVSHQTEVGHLSQLLMHALVGSLGSTYLPTTLTYAAGETLSEKIINDNKPT